LSEPGRTLYTVTKRSLRQNSCFDRTCPTNLFGTLLIVTREITTVARAGVGATVRSIDVAKSDRTAHRISRGEALVRGLDFTIEDAAAMEPPITCPFRERRTEPQFSCSITSLDASANRNAHAWAKSA
jgi:hypothetical protein